MVVALTGCLIVASCASQSIATTSIPTRRQATVLPRGRWRLVRAYTPAQLARWSPAPWPKSNSYELACFARRDVHVHRYLELSITNHKCDGLPESGAWLQSQQMRRYGLYEARIYLPASSEGKIANWPAFWLENPIDWPVNGEIDIMESWAGEDCQQIHYGPRANVKRSEKTVPQCVLSKPGWYTFGVWWTPGRVRWYIDGRPTGTVDKHVASDPMMIVLDYTAWRGQLDNLAPATMRVAWVRIYRSKF